MFKLNLENISKKYGEKIIINNLNISIKNGERVSILGPSGCGKSTLFKIAAGIIDDFDGKVILDNKEISNVPTNKRNIVIVSQENLLFPHMNVFENIAFGLRVRKKDESYIKTTVEGLLEETGLRGYNNKKVTHLSGGEKQRVALARALAVKPELLLLDEAYSSLDTNLREKMRELTITLQKKHNITMILVTHDKKEAILFSDRVAIMLNGKIVQFEKPNLIYENPINLEVARFMADNNFIEIENKTIFIKIEDIDTSRMEQENYISGIVRECKYSGSRNIYQIEVKLLDLINVIDIKYDNKKKALIYKKTINIFVEEDKNIIYEKEEKIFLKIKKYNIY